MNEYGTLKIKVICLIGLTFTSDKTTYIINENKVIIIYNLSVFEHFFNSFKIVFQILLRNSYEEITSKILVEINIYYVYILIYKFNIKLSNKSETEDSRKIC